MSKKKKSWAEIKAMKPIEEWRRINRAYGLRRRLKNQLVLQAAGLTQQIQNYRLIQNPGPADVLLDEVNKALRLRYAWGQEDYDHAVARLEDIARNVKNIQRQFTPKTSVLANIMMLIMMNSKDTEETKAGAALNLVEYMANQLSVEQVHDLEETKINFLMTQLRTRDDYYPSWLPKAYYENMASLLSDADLQQLIGWIQDRLESHKNRDKILALINMQEEEEDGKEIR